MAVNQRHRQPKRFQINNEGVTISQEDHEKLVKHVRDKLDFGNQIRRNLVTRLESIDKELSGYIAPEGDDAIRDAKNKLGKGGPRPVDVSLPLVAVQLDECVTFLMNVLAPDNEMYETTAEASMVEQARAFTTILNQNALDFQHYRNMAKSLFNAMKYNIGGLATEWHQIIGRGINFDESNRAGEVRFTDGDIVSQGNALINIDPYNCIWDTTVLPIDVPMQGEFFATVEMITPFKMHKAIQQRVYFNADDLVDTSGVEVRYYQQKPAYIVEPVGVQGTNGQINWRSTLQPDIRVFTDAKSIELVHTRIWLKPKDFKLGTKEQLEIWLITLANGHRIVRAVPLDYAHGMLPCGFFMPWEDETGLGALSYGEILKPLQHYASFKINVDQHGQRKALNNTLVLDERAFQTRDPDQFRDGVVFANPSFLVDSDIRKIVMRLEHEQNDDAPQRVGEIVDLMQHILPTSIQRAMGDLERATMYQAAWTVQAANRRPYKIARIVNDQGLEFIRRQMYFNVLQFQKAIEILDPESGELVQINPSTIARARIKFLISTGLKGIDRLQITEGLRDIINMLLQSKVANDRIDVVKVIDYWMSLMGDRFDFTSFKFENAFDTLTPEQKQAAFELLQQAIAEQEDGEGAGGAGPEENPLMSLVAGQQ